MNDNPITIDNPEDIEEDFKNALSSFDRSVKKVRLLGDNYGGRSSGNYLGRLI